MSGKPRVVVFSIIPRLGEIVKQLLPQENVKIVQYQDDASGKYGHAASEEADMQLQEAEVLLADNSAFQQNPKVDAATANVQQYVHALVGWLSDNRMAVSPHEEKLSSLRWFQGTWAGVEGLAAYFKDKAAPSYLMSRMSSTNFCQLMAEYVVGQIIVQERGWRVTDANQALCKWNTDGRVLAHRSLGELTVAVLGTGQIGQEIGRALKGFRCRVLGLSRSPRDPTQLPLSFDLLYNGADGLLDIVSSSDYIVSCLPSTPQTTGLLSSAVLQQARQGSVLLNIGRSNVVSEEDLLTSLGEGGRLAAAVLDVFDTEPLPATSKLWTHPKVMITPHCAGVSLAQDVAATFVENYKRYTTGQPLNFQVDITRGY